MNVSGRSASVRAPAIVSWSVIVTKSIPRRLASSYTSPGSVAHSGTFNDRWTPSFDSADAVEWTCMSALLVLFMSGKLPCKLRDSVKKAMRSCDHSVNDAWPGASGENHSRDVDGESLDGAGARLDSARALRAARRNRVAAVLDDLQAPWPQADARRRRVGGPGHGP